MSENYFYSSLSGQEIEDTLVGAVRFNAGQELSTSQKAQARQNIGAGAENTGFRILGYFDTLEDLQEYLQTPPQAGDAYGIGTSVPYDIYVWDAANEEWVDNGTLDIAEFIDDTEVSSILTWSSQKINTQLAGKQDALVSGTNIKTVGNQSLLGSGDISQDFVNYASAQSLTTAQQAQARDNIGASADWVLMWQNASPNSSFAAQKVYIDLSGKSELKIVSRRLNSQDMSVQSVITVFVPIGVPSSISEVSGVNYNRGINGSSTQYVDFADGGYFSNGSNWAWTIENTDMVPWKIYAK